MKPQPPLHISTPLLESIPLSEVLGNDSLVLLKMEAFQPSGSFKIRGIGNFCQRAFFEDHFKRFISSSGGNAGMAVAHCGRVMGVPVTVVVPSTTSEVIRKRLIKSGAELCVHGRVWDEADLYARKLCQLQSEAVYVHPFDHPRIWEGHASILSEIADEIQRRFPISYAQTISTSTLSTSTSTITTKRMLIENGSESFPTEATENPPVDAIVCAVGGGGLLCGLLQGLRSLGDRWWRVPVITCETRGAASFHEARQAGQPVSLEAISSIATSLGARRVCDECLRLSDLHGQVISCVVDDLEAVNACLRFADDERCLVEPACGAALAVLYSQHIELCKLLNGKRNARVVVIVCGGNGVSLEAMNKWKEMLEAHRKQHH
jgi:L-serine/L-threonine ammonia-lyase